MLFRSENKAVCSLLKDQDPNGRIYLFGSRVDDNKKGGDIDLFFETSVPLTLKQQLTLEYRLSVECDTKVDLLLKPQTKKSSPYL